MAGTLIVHAGGRAQTRADLQGLYTPPATDSWTPVPHYDLIQALIAGLADHEVSILKEQYATSGKDDARLFGVLDLQIPHLAQPDYAMSIGVRASNDKSFAISAVAGVRVFVCDNLAFSGDSGTVVLRKKHTARLDLAACVPPAIDAYLAKADQFRLDVEAMKNVELTDGRAKEIVYDAFAKRVLPVRLFDDVHRLYFKSDEQRAMFPDRSLWTLNNAFTEAVKALRVTPQHRAGISLGRYFNLVLDRKPSGGFAMSAEVKQAIADGEIQVPSNGFVDN
jgi:hypothetical protein